MKNCSSPRKSNDQAQSWMAKQSQKNLMTIDMAQQLQDTFNGNLTIKLETDGKNVRIYANDSETRGKLRQHMNKHAPAIHPKKCNRLSL